jgi:sugar phosphate permease
MSDMNLTASQFSKISAAFSIGYSLTQILAGYMLEKVSFRYLSSGLLLIGSMIGYIFVSTNDPIIAEYTRYVLGFCFSIGSIGALKYLSVVWSSKFGILSNGISILMNLAAAVAASGTIRGLFDTYGWKNCLKVYIIFGLILSVILFITLKVMTEKEKEMALEAKKKQATISSSQEKKISFIESIRNIIRVPHISFSAIYAMTICAASYVLMDGSGNTLLKAKFPQLDAAAISLPATLNMWGAAIGGLFNIYNNQKKISSKNQMLMHAVLCLISVFTLVFGNPGFYTFLICCFFMGFSASGSAISFVWLEKNLAYKYHGTGFGTLNFVSMFFGSAVVQRLSGVILDIVKNNKIKSGVLSYSGYTYLDILDMFKYLLIGITVLAFLSAFFVKDNVKEEEI